MPGFGARLPQGSDSSECLIPLKQSFYEDLYRLGIPLCASSKCVVLGNGCLPRLTRQQRQSLPTMDVRCTLQCHLRLLEIAPHAMMFQLALFTCLEPVVEICRWLVCYSGSVKVLVSDNKYKRPLVV